MADCHQLFLSLSSQVMDFLIKADWIQARLTAREKGSASAKETAVTKREKKLFAGQTHCTALVRIADCANYRAG